MRRILVTGANKGIGLAIVRAILERADDTFVFLGSRDLERGHAAIKELPATARTRIEVVGIDVASDASVSAARDHIASTLGGEKLYGVVNNAGIGTGNAMRHILQTNTYGVRRVCENCASLIENGGRVVNVTSAAGPTFVGACSPERRRIFLDESTSWLQLEDVMNECLAIEGKPAEFAAKGLGDGSAYGLSKACANTYTLGFAQRHPELHVNACTPGFIETDMTRGYATSQNKSAAEVGMKPPSAGAVAPMHLLFDELEGNGRYYGSDAKRSPLDRYRAPGSPEYNGD